jgi:UDP-3-O-[3-hydroxymyristoyl] glucosamine N-acyltransferase
LGATVAELASLVRGRLTGDGQVEIRAARPVSAAGAGDITFVDDDRFAKQLRSSPAAAAIVGPHFRKLEIASSLPTIEVDDPLDAFLTVRAHLGGPKPRRWTGIHPTACIAPTARVGNNVAIHPFVCIGEDCVIGDGSTLHPGVVIGARCTLGQSVTLHPNTVLYDDVKLGNRVEVHAGTVLGGDGFGYRLQDGRHVKIPQTGWVEIGDDVEIGANGAIDRGTFEATSIGDGTKIDNLVMIGHNNRIGRHNILCGQVGVAGSCQTGDYVIMAGQVGVKDHIEIGDRAVVAAQGGVIRNIPPNQQVMGTPAIDSKEQRHIFAMVTRLPQIYKQLKELTAKVEQLWLARGDSSSGPATPET